MANRTKPAALSALPFLFAFVLPATAAVGLAIGGWTVFLALAYAYVVLPILDSIVPPHFERGRPGGRSIAHDAMLLAVVPVQLALIAGGLWFVTRPDIGIVEAVAATLSVGASTGAIGITTAHELVHRRQGWMRGAGLVLLALVLDMQFRIEHVHGHHRSVGTPLDPATARLGQSLYAFFPQSLWGQHRHAFAIEAARLERRGRWVFGWRNRMLWYLAVEAALLVGVGIAFGPAGLGFFIGQALFACFLLESVNYIEHYGLQRRALEDGRYERIAAKHSWNANQRLTNWTLFNLGRHSAHHIHEAWPYQGLGDERSNPQLPAGYGVSVVLAMVPPLWRHLMDRRAVEANAIA